jgi:hypothetical protein
MLVNRGGDPERDDYPLPPVDIEIPDDARELERDVQDYHRELRAQRRHRLARRLGGSITRDGMVLPLLASCLALTLLAGTLLTMFTARRVVPPATQTTSEPQTATPTPTPRPTVGQPGAPLPDATVAVDSAATPLLSLKPAVLVLVPVGCRCAQLARQLATRASAAKVSIYFAAVTARSAAQAQARALVQQARANRSTRKRAHLLTDKHGVLATAYQPQPGELTAILVNPDGSVSRIDRAQEPAGQLGTQIKDQIKELGSTRTVSLKPLGGTVLAANQAGLGAA